MGALADGADEPDEAIDSQAAASVPPINAARAGNYAYTTYRKFVVPKIVDSYINNGRAAEAKALLDFTREQEGEDYTKDWLGIGRSVRSGDYETALPALVELYNQNVPDGLRAELESIGDDQYRVSHFDQTTGTKVSEREFAAPDFANLAYANLSPAKRVEAVLAAQQERRQETRKPKQDAPEDQRAGQSENIDQRLAADGTPTLTQERDTLEIDVAPAEGKRQEPQSPESRFASDPAMNNFKLGKLSSLGFEVLDASGKLLGHYG